VTKLKAVLTSDYPAELLAGMVINFQIAAIALALGLVLGVLLLVAGPGLPRTVNTLNGLMRAAPTFVVMFFLMNIFPQQFQVFGIDIVLPPGWIVALSLAPYAIAYVVDNGRAAIEGLRAGSRSAALLFLPNLVRAFTVLVMSSSVGVAIGVNEGVAVVLREAETYAALGDQMLVYAVGVFAFGAFFQIGFACVRLMMRLLSPSEGTRVSE
jgi:ABC-type amino acid transport system permease subunit